MLNVRSAIAASLCAMLLSAGAAQAIVIKLTDPNADFYDGGTDPCPRGDINDDCLCASYLSAGLEGRDGSARIFQRAWAAWNAAQPAGRKWRMIQGPALTGTLSITKFDTFNNCPGTQGVTCRAYFTPGPGDPRSWTWVQGLWDNYESGVVPAHDSRGAPYRYEMDVSNAAGAAQAPAYPGQYPDGRYFDEPQAYCIHNSSVNFDAVALMARLNYTNRTMIVYQGFAYGWTINCTHFGLPAPGPVGLAMVGGLFACRRRRRGQ